MIYNGFSSSTDLYEATFMDGVFTAGNTSIRFNDSESNEALLRLSIYNITPDSFPMDIKKLIELRITGATKLCPTF